MGRSSAALKHLRKVQKAKKRKKAKLLRSRQVSTGEDSEESIKTNGEAYQEVEKYFTTTII